MKPISLFLSLFIAALFISSTKQSDKKELRVNPLIGDISFVSKFGYLPDENTNNELRVKTHLEYVENLLRQKDVSHLPEELRIKRNQLLDLLKNYHSAGIFPQNFDYADECKPCFIDKNNTICAVGYLLEQTAGRQVADEINNSHKYDELLAMNDQTVDAWIAESGLTKEECAMIQPAYGGSNLKYISPGYGYGSSALSGLNASLCTVNGLQIAKGAGNKAVPVVGLITGFGQFAIGSAKYFYSTLWYGNNGERNLSMVNIGLGTTTMILSTWNLLANRKPKEKLSSLNLYSVPVQNNKSGLALGFTRKF